MFSYKKTIKYMLKIKVVPMAFCFCKRHIPQRKMKLDGMMISIVRYINPTVNQIHAVFRKKASAKHEQLLIIETLIDNTESILINLYNTNTENDQLTTFSELTILLENFNLTNTDSISR